MASTNKTTNYELSQFIETDRPAWLTDYNGDMRTIDSTMKAISDVASGASGSISELTDRMSTAEGNITTNANDIDALEARADSLEAGQTSDDSRLDALEAEQIVQNTAIESNTRLGYNLARPYDSASTYAVGAYVLFQDTLYKCTTAISTGEAFDPNKWLAIKATDEIAAGGYTLPTASASTLGGVKVGSGLSIDPVTGILSASGGALQLETIPNSDIFEIQSGDISSAVPSGNSYKYGNMLFVNLMFTFPTRTQSTYQSGDLYLAHLKSNYQPLQYTDGRSNSLSLSSSGVESVRDVSIVTSNRGVLAHIFKISSSDITYSAITLQGIILLNT